LLGLKPPAVTILLGLDLLVAGCVAARVNAGPLYMAVLEENAQLCTVGLLNLALLVIWTKVVHPEFVLQAADDYGIALFRTLEMEPQP
jgi:hypothetical protein